MENHNIGPPEGSKIQVASLVEFDRGSKKDQEKYFFIPIQYMFREKDGSHCWIVLYPEEEKFSTIFLDAYALGSCKVLVP